VDVAETKLRTRRGLAWVGLATVVVALLDIAAMWVVLRVWISPTQLGVASMVATLFPILDLATDLGLSSAVIQRDDHTPEKISTVFWINLAMSGVLAALLFPAGELLAAFHGQPVLAWMLAAYGAKLVFQNFFAIPQALMRRQLRFKELQVIRIFANLAEFGGKIGFAAAGFGVWMFVLAPMCRILVTGIGIQLRHPWRPRFVLRVRETRSYLTFGAKTSASQILFFVYTTLHYQVVGKFFGATSLGYYRWAYDLVLEPVRTISNVVIEIAFPVFARLRGQTTELVEQLVAFTRQNLVIALPFLAVVFLAADDILLVFFGPQWVAAAPAARLLCLVGVLRTVSLVMPPLLDGIGHPSSTLLYMVVAAIVLPAGYFGFAVWLGPSLDYVSVAYAWLFCYPIAFLVLMTLTLTRIEVSAWAFLRRIGGVPLCVAAAMLAGAAVRPLLHDVSAGLRLAAISGVTVVVVLFLLAYFQGISVRTIARSLQKK